MFRSDLPTLLALSYGRCRFAQLAQHDNPILVTGAAGAVGGIGRNLTEFLLAKGHKVRALVRREDKRAEALRRLGAEVVGVKRT